MWDIRILDETLSTNDDAAAWPAAVRLPSGRLFSVTRGDGYVRGVNGYV